MEISEPFILNIPGDIGREIMKYLPIRDVANYRATCLAAKNFVRDNPVFAGLTRHNVLAHFEFIILIYGDKALNSIFGAQSSNGDGAISVGTALRQYRRKIGPIPGSYGDYESMKKVARLLFWASSRAAQQASSRAAQQASSRAAQQAFCEDASLASQNGYMAILHYIMEYYESTRRGAEPLLPYWIHSKVCGEMIDGAVSRGSVFILNWLCSWPGFKIVGYRYSSLLRAIHFGYNDVFEWWLDNRLYYFNEFAAAMVKHDRREMMLKAAARFEQNKAELAMTILELGTFNQAKWWFSTMDKPPILPREYIWILFGRYYDYPANVSKDIKSKSAKKKRILYHLIVEGYELPRCDVIIERASANGQIEILDLWHNHGNIYFTFEAFIAAVNNCRLDVLEWWYYRRYKSPCMPCTIRIDQPLLNGRFDILNWLVYLSKSEQKNITLQVSPKDLLIYRGHIITAEMTKWVNSNPVSVRGGDDMPISWSNSYELNRPSLVQPDQRDDSEPDQRDDPEPDCSIL